MTLALLTASTVGACWLSALAVLSRLPRHVRCPSCGCATAAVLPPAWLRPGARWVSLRWCASCSWQGLGRKGAERVPGLDLGHDSGFAWGADRSEQDRGFAWATARPDAAGRAPEHPCGFRFARRLAPPSPRAFRFRAPGSEAGSAPASGLFAWRRGAPALFQWGDAPARDLGFRWASGAAAPDSARRRA